MKQFIHRCLWLVVVFDFVAFTRANIFEFGPSEIRKFLAKQREGKSKTNPGSDFEISTNSMPAADGNFHVYALPVGQGSGQILQCPNGDVAIIDLGSRDTIGSGFWSTNDIKAFLLGHYNRIKNIVITHNHDDHYSFFSKVFSSASDLNQLRNIYISCTPEDMDATLYSWINSTRSKHKVRMFKKGHTCGSSNGKTCEKINLCPENQEIKTLVLSANAANCNNSNKNIDSIVIGIKFKNFTIQLNGDFEDFTANSKEVTVYMLAHHGADRYANKPVMLNAVKPKAVFASSNPWYPKDTWRHPRCNITDYFIHHLECLCKPAEMNMTSKYYCGQHPIKGITLNNTLQREFACGMDSLDPPRRNEFAIYSTAPSKNKINLVHVVTDGIKWGFINNIQPRLTEQNV